ncbi:hypothetical protein [Streptomyces sp. NPDC047315]|uniref:hypothetical protein n=1 Tax=Streptomyces sp. NPDC047315 TaxID=3155142 RepID=UPI0034093B03
MLRRARSRLGRRGAYLVCLGTVWVLYGAGLLVQPVPDTRGLRHVLALAPMDVWAWCWIVAGVVAVVAAWKPTGRDWPGFAALTVMLVLWALSYAAAWAGGEYSRGWIAAAIWAAVGAGCAVVAGWPEPPRSER